jgi:hypothetical protein
MRALWVNSGTAKRPARRKSGLNNKSKYLLTATLLSVADVHNSHRDLKLEPPSKPAGFYWHGLSFPLFQIRIPFRPVIYDGDEPSVVESSAREPAPFPTTPAPGRLLSRLQLPKEEKLHQRRRECSCRLAEHKACRPDLRKSASDGTNCPSPCR